MPEVASPSLIDTLLERKGQTFADEVGMRLEKNTPAGLFQLLYTSMLLGARIRYGNAVEAARALIKAGLTSPQKMADATWQERVDVITWHGYKRYDERTSTMLGETAEIVLEKYQGDLRKLREAAGRDVKREHALLQEFKGIGKVGADIFLREIQTVWDEAYPYADQKVLQAAKRLGLPSDPQKLAGLVEEREFARLAAALIRTQVDEDYDQIREHAER